LKKFNTEEYTTRRIKELRGERIYHDHHDEEILRYTRRRMREIQKSEEAQRTLDKSPAGCYTVSTMGDRDGET